MSALVKKKRSVGRKKAAITVKKKSAAQKSVGSYNEVKHYLGQQYVGMMIGKSHSWHYDKGDWKETKITPDLWEISYAVTKRRKGHAPEGSGVPVGTEYQWYILAHQNVRKLNANDYTTEMTGLKYKLAHKRALNKWSSSAKAQRKKLVALMKELIVQLEKEPVTAEFEYNGTSYKLEAIPVSQTCHDGICDEMEITLNERHLGIIKHRKSGWKLDNAKDQKLINLIGKQIEAWYNE